MFLTHTATHQAIRCDLGMLTDDCSYQVSFSMTLPLFTGTKLLETLFRGISISHFSTRL